MSDPHGETDDTHLQLGFRALAAAAREARSVGVGSDQVMRIALTPPQVAALMLEVSKQLPERTAEVDRAALEAMQAVRALFASRWSRPEMRDARVQLAITDAICRCLPAPQPILHNLGEFEPR